MFPAIPAAVAARLAALLTLALVAASGAHAAPPTTPAPDEPAFPGQDECHVDLPAGTSWAPQEKWVWERICTGEHAYLGLYAIRNPDVTAYGCDPENADDWPSAHVQLSMRFLDLVLRHPRYRRVVPDTGVRIVCATFPAEVDLAHAELPWPLEIAYSHFGAGANFHSLSVDGLLDLNGSVMDSELAADRLDVGTNLYMNDGAAFQGVNLLGASVGDQLHADGSTFQGKFNADRLDVGTNLYMDDGATFRGVRLLGASVGGQLHADGSTFQGKFNADGIDVGGNLYMNDGATFRGVRLLGASVGGTLTASGSTFEGKFRADGIDVGGNLYMNDGATFQGVDLLGASVAGQLPAPGSTFKGPLDAAGLEVGDEMFLGSGSTFGAVDLSRAKIGDTLVMDNSTYRGGVDLTSTTIAGTLKLASSGGPATWDGDDAGLTLRNAHAGKLVDTRAAWALPNGNLDLRGFTYDRLGSPESGSEPDAAWRTGHWLTKQARRNDAFQPQPYRQLASVLRESGYRGKAERVRMDLRDHERAHAETPTDRKVWLAVSDWLLGYGHQPWRAIVALLVLFVIGAGVPMLYAENRRRDRIASCCFHSLDAAVPFMSLNPTSQDFAQRLPPRADRYFTFHKICAFVLVSVLIASMTGLVK